MDLSALRDAYSGGCVFSFTVLLILLTVLYTWIFQKSRKDTAPLPPGPRGLPVIGNLPFLEPDLNRCFADLTKIYGPIFKLRLGSRLCVVLGSPAVAKEALTDHDIIFADRDVPAVGFAASFGGADMVWSPYGEHWRMVRRICAAQFLNNKTVESLYDIRRTEAQNLVQSINSMIGSPVAINEYVFATSYNTFSGMLWSGSLVGEEKKEIMSEFQTAIDSIAHLLGEINISDIFPILAKFDLQRKEHKMKELMSKFDKVFDRIINQRLRMETRDYSDFLQVLLHCRDQADQNSVPLTITHIKAILMDMMFAGTKASATELEWTLAELIRQPNLMKKAQEEIEQVVGRNYMVEETHLPKLPYLNAIVKEVLRLHPPAPLLIPRRSKEACVVGGYVIPKDTKILINVWGIQRDPAHWDKPLEFNPERFMGSNGEQGDYNGTNFSYMPFGSGRRVCAGIPLAERMIPYLLATLLHSFDWKMEEGAIIDMSKHLVWNWL